MGYKQDTGDDLATLLGVIEVICEHDGGNDQGNLVCFICINFFIIYYCPNQEF